MDLTTWLGAGALIAVSAGAFLTGGVPAFFINAHGIVIVFGGTAAATLINTSAEDLRRAFGSLRRVFRESPYPERRQTIRVMASLAEQYRSRGVIALREVDSRVVAGFLKRAAETAQQHTDPEIVREILEGEINSSYDRNNETIDVFRTMAVLSPMFGLLGTLIGIVSVLKQLARPDSVGTAMAVAMTTAFYGIALSNAVFLPVAGKLRSRNLHELRTKAIVCEGLVMILGGAVPATVERKLNSYA